MSCRALEVFTTGIHVAGNNIANANTPGFVREELLLAEAPPFRKGNLILGTGVLAVGIVQSIDNFLEARIQDANSDTSAAKANNTIYKQLENQIRELGENDLSTSLNNFLSSIHDVVNQPESTTLRQILVQQGTQFSKNVSLFRSRVDELRSAQAININSLVDEANSLLDQVTDLNPKIAQLEAAGELKSEATSLRSQRLTALNRLSEIIPIDVRTRSNGDVDVYSGSNYLILGTTSQRLETVTAVDRGIQIHNVQLSATKASLNNLSGGELKGILDGRDQVLGGFIDSLDQYISTTIFEFNKIHASGEGLVGFNSLTSEHAITDATVALNNTANGLKFIPTHGSFEIKVINKLSGLAETTRINVDLDGIGTDSTLNSLIASLSAVNNITASQTAKGTLQIDANSNFEFRFGDDTSGILAAMGLNTFFSGSDSTNIGINTNISKDSRLFAAGLGAGPADGRNAVKLSGFAEKTFNSLAGESLDSFYNSIISGVGQGSAAAGALLDGFNGFLDSLTNQRAQFSGVSLDEEAIKLIEFQRAFQASARVISTIDEMFGILLNI